MFADTLLVGLLVGIIVCKQFVCINFDVWKHFIIFAAAHSHQHHRSMPACLTISSLSKGLQIMLTVMFLACFSRSARGQEEMIEHEGNRYIIHVEQLNPDPEMTLLDVLHICPELMSNDGKKLTSDYLLSVDDIVLSIDYEPLLEGIKACDLSKVIVCTYGTVNNATDGTTGTIDLTFREGKGLTGKLALSGSTYGNGRMYTDMASGGDNVTVRAFAQNNLQYGNADALSGTSITSRYGVENAMVFVATDRRAVSPVAVV